MEIWEQYLCNLKKVCVREKKKLQWNFWSWMPFITAFAILSQLIALLINRSFFFPKWCIVLRVHIRLCGEQLTRYAYAESNSAEPKSQNMKRAKGVFNNKTAAVYYLSNNNSLFFVTLLLHVRSVSGTQTTPWQWTPPVWILMSQRRWQTRPSLSPPYW